MFGKRLCIGQRVKHCWEKCCLQVLWKGKTVLALKCVVAENRSARTHTRSKWVVFDWDTSLLNCILFGYEVGCNQPCTSHSGRRYFDDSLWSLGNVKSNRNSKRQFAFPGILSFSCTAMPSQYFLSSLPFCLPCSHPGSLCWFSAYLTLSSAGNIAVTSFGLGVCLLPFWSSVLVLLSLWEYVISWEKFTSFYNFCMT